MKKIGILSGAFNPLTRAHVALAEAARAVVDEMVAVIPRAYPHKEFHGATIGQRQEMLARSGAFDRVEVTEGGLFIDMARELAQPEAELYFVCGRDAAERVLTWDYGDPSAAARMLDRFQLLVTARHGEFSPPPQFASRISVLELSRALDHVSSTEVRDRIAGGEPWEHLVPEPITGLVREIYQTSEA